MALDGPRRMLRSSHEVRIFISSAGDVVRERQMLDDIINHLGRSIANQRGWSQILQLTPVRWEDIHSQKTPGGNNSEFVRHATECQLAIVLFRDKHGSGTHEELLAVERNPHTELSVIRIAPKDPKSEDSKEIDALLASEKDKIYHKRVDDDDLAIYSALWNTVISHVLSYLAVDQTHIEENNSQYLNESVERKGGML